MATLDCESLESAMQSICTLYGIEKTTLVKFLRSVDLDDEFRRKTIHKDCAGHLHDLFHAEFGSPCHPLESVCWFHLTRISKSADFSEGILPLDLALDKVWTTVISIPRDSRTRAKLEKLRTNGVTNLLYTLKVGNRRAGGPFALLVRESAFCPKSVGNHDYLDIPEIIEDICLGYQESYGTSIQVEISAGLAKCIVKFEAKPDGGSMPVERALQYCWIKVHNDELSTTINWCYDGGGETVPFTAIRKIDFV
jgi:hypothetical protein